MAWEPDYVVDTDLKHYLKISNTDDDPELGLAITSASRSIDNFCSNRKNGLGARRQFGKVAAPEARYYTPRWDRFLTKWVIEIDDLQDITGLTVLLDTHDNDVFDATVTQYLLRPRDALLRNMAYTQIAIDHASSAQPTIFEDSAKITASWGWNAVPTAVKQATMLQASRFFKRRVAPFRQSGSPQRATMSVQNVDEVDPDIGMMLEHYVKLAETL